MVSTLRQGHTHTLRIPVSTKQYRANDGDGSVRCIQPSAVFGCPFTDRHLQIYNPRPESNTISAITNIKPKAKKLKKKEQSNYSSLSIRSAYTMLRRSPWNPQNLEDPLFIPSLDQTPSGQFHPLLPPQYIRIQPTLVQAHTFFTRQ